MSLLKKVNENLHMKRILLLSAINFFIAATSFAQDTTDISKMLENQLKAEEKNKTQYVTATFKTTRLINGHSVENTAPGVLDLKISHRFGAFSDGPSQFFGFDEAKMRLGFDYGITNTFMVGIGRSSELKMYDAFFKWKILRQSTGKHNIPVTLSYIPIIEIEGRQDNTNTFKGSFNNRISFTNQLIIGRKFSEGLSLQIMPTLVHRNLPQDGGPNNVYAIGIGGRQKLNKRTTFNVEYYYQLPGSKVPGSSNVLSLGFDIETGGHVFQLFITNSMSMDENTFITGNKYGEWPNRDLRFGFNISRVFSIGKKHTKEW